MRIVPAIVALLVLGFALPASAQGVEGSAAIRVEPEVQQPAAEAKAGTGKAKPRASRHAPVALAPPLATESAQIEAPRKQGVPHRIGFPRPITALQGEEGTGRKLEWEPLEEGGMVASVSVTSPGAAALRLGLRIRETPPDAMFRFYDPAGEEVFEVTGASIMAAIAANAGEEGADARTYWSPVIESSTAVMEIELPPGARPGDLRMSVPLVSHLVTAAKSGFLMPKAAAACENDAMCQVAAWSTQMNAVARMVFSSGGFSYLCTGTLLADSDTTTTIPYFLSANHCINTQATATSLATYWFWRSTACNSGTRGPAVQLQGGATLLYSSTATDVSFMRLNATPPAGATYAGWIAGAPLATNAAVTGLHHPTGDLLKISTGNVLGYLTCTPPTSGQFSCSVASAAGGGTFYDVGWNSGVVEGGSSGSALFDSGKYVVGQLYGGSSSCADPAAGDSYGRFDISYQTALSTWLNPPPPPPPPVTPVRTLTVTKAGAGTGIVSSNPGGISCGTTCGMSFISGALVTLVGVASTGSTFGGWSGACTGGGPCTVRMDNAVNVTATFNAVPSVNAGVSMSAPFLAFGNFQGTQTLTYRNDSGARVTFLQASIDSPRFSQVNDCGDVGPGASCTASVTYYPSNIGADIATFVMTSTASNSPHVASLSAAASFPARLTSISARMQVLTGNDVMIGGFVIGGSAAKKVVIRARGPSLASQGITNALANPALQLVRASDQATIASNDNWGASADAAAISASGFAPPNPLEAAILMTLAPGAYTAIVSGADNGTGIGIVEVYEVDHPEIPLAGISTRGQVRGGNDVMSGGFVIQGTGSQTVVVRARGPSLAAAGVAGALPNPTLQLVRASDQFTIGVNDDWGTAANASAIAASGYAPASPLDAAILVTLAPGAYTAIVSGVGGATGVGIVEVFAQ